MLSVALSLTLRPVGVTHHHVLRSPDFPLAETCCWADMAARRVSTSDHPVYSKPNHRIKAEGGRGKGEG